MKKYDAIIIGAGPMGIFTAYELMLKSPELKVLLIDKGHDIYHRVCPIILKKIKQCPKDMYGNSGCKPACSITCGFGGAGAYSDGKFNITNEFGGWMGDYMESEEVLDLIKYVDEINLKHGAPSEITDPNTKEVLEIERRGIAVGLKLLRSEVRHLGTEINLKVLQSIFEEMKNHVDYMFSTEVKDIIVEDNQVKGVILNNEEVIESEYVIIGVGRGGSDWQTKVLERHGIKLHNNRVDIGVRVETNDIIMEEINRTLYEGKFLYKSSVGTTVRTFCSNPSGHVVVENFSGVMLANGHAYNDPKLGSKNTYVMILQDALNNMGRPLSIDGIFGNSTKNAVINFQRYYGLTPDGIVGCNTWRKWRTASARRTRFVISSSIPICVSVRSRTKTVTALS